MNWLPTRPHKTLSFINYVAKGKIVLERGQNVCNTIYMNVILYQLSGDIKSQADACTEK